jgi:hypothetical protein
MNSRDRVTQSLNFQQPDRVPLILGRTAPADAPWQIDYSAADIPESEWARIPSEQYAEATIELVHG